MNYLNWLHSMSGMKLGLENITSLLNRFQNPHQKLKFIHIAGTNGKGSVTAMTYSILKKAGYSVGMYTSPHLIKYNERIIVDGICISDEDLSRLCEKVYSDAVELKCTYFEVATAIAFLYFLDKNVDFVCLEVGMGGRLDSTNVVTPLVSVITSIGLEHTKYLGDTIEKIAFEKAGIIKNTIPLVTATDGAAFETILKIAKERDCEIYQINQKNLTKLKTNLLGDFQIVNASMVCKVIDILTQKYGYDIPPSAIKEGLRNVKWPGRMDFVFENVLIDVAHNPHGMNVLIEELKKLKKSKFKKITLLIGMLRDKDYVQVLSMADSIVDRIIFCSPKTDRALAPNYLATYSKCNQKIILPNVDEAFDFAINSIKKDELLLVSGSLYTAGEVYAHLQKTNRLGNWFG